MGAVNDALLNLQSRIAAPGGVTVATAAYTATVAATTAAQTAVLDAIEGTEAEIGTLTAASWVISGASGTLSGNVVAGAIFTATVNGTAYNYTATRTDTVASVVNQLAVMISIGLGLQAFVIGGILSVPSATTFTAGPLGPPSIPNVILDLIAEVGDLASLAIIQGYTNRIAVNLANAST